MFFASRIVLSCFEFGGVGSVGEFLKVALTHVVGMVGDAPELSPEGSGGHLLSIALSEILLVRIGLVVFIIEFQRIPHSVVVALLSGDARRLEEFLLAVLVVGVARRERHHFF